MIPLLRDTVARLFGWALPATGREIATGTMGAVGTASPAFPASLSMAQLVRHPYVYACVDRIASDLSGLSLRAYDVRTGAEVELPLALRGAPNASESLRELRAQLVADEALTGNAYVLRVDRSSYRLHPALVQIEYDGLGLPTGYVVSGRTRLTLAEVGHVRGLSWKDGAAELFGEAPVRALYDELQAAARAKEHAARAAARGRPEWLVTPRDEGMATGEDTARKIVATWEKQLQSGHGAVFMGEPLVATPLSTTLRDMEYQVLQERADFAILAVFGVPPTVVGIPAANYGTSKQDARRYWDNLRPRAARFDEMFTRLYGEGRVVIRHDFSGVEPLIWARTESIEQAERLVGLGAMPHAALVFSGVANPPMAPDTEPRETVGPSPARDPDEPQEPRRTLRDALAESRLGYERATRVSGSPDRRLADLEIFAPLVGEERAVWLAEHLRASVLDHLADCARTGTEPYVRGLAIWSPGFEAALTRHLEAA